LYSSIITAFSPRLGNTLMRGNSTIWSSAVHGTQCRNPEHHPTGKGSTTKGKATTGTAELSNNGEAGGAL